MFKKVVVGLVFLVSLVCAQCSLPSGTTGLNDTGYSWYENIKLGSTMFSASGAKVSELVIFTYDSIKFGYVLSSQMLKCHRFVDVCNSSISACEAIRKPCFVTFQNSKYMVAFAEYKTNCRVLSGNMVCDTKTTSFLFDSNLTLLNRLDLDLVNPKSRLAYTFTNNHISLNVTDFVGVSTWNDSILTYKVTVDAVNNNFSVAYSVSRKSSVMHISPKNVVTKKNTKMEMYNLLGRMTKDNKSKIYHFN